jgi:hypothetical protein
MISTYRDTKIETERRRGWNKRLSVTNHNKCVGDIYLRSAAINVPCRKECMHKWYTKTSECHSAEVHDNL